MFRSLRSTTFAFVLVASVAPLGLFGCSGSASVGEPSTTASGTETTAPLTTQVHGGARVIADALATIPLRADQRATIEQMAKDSETRSEPTRKAREQLILAIANQVQAGTIDHTALQPQIDAVAAAHQAARPADRAALEKLHDLLTPSQRVAFATAMESHGHAHVNGANGPNGGHAGGGHMQKWAADLGLSQDQQDQIRQKFQARWQQHLASAVTGTDEQKAATPLAQDTQMVMQGHAMHTQMKNVLEAFKGDTFSMDQVAPMTDTKPMAHEFAGHLLGMVETALPVLTPEQRTLAAAKLRERAAKFEDDEVVAPAAGAQ